MKTKTTAASPGETKRTGDERSGETKSFKIMRLERMLDVTTLAASSGVSVQTIARIEKGTTVPRVRVIRLLSAALGVEPRSVTEFRPVCDRLMEEAVEDAEAREA